MEKLAGANAVVSTIGPRLAGVRSLLASDHLNSIHSCQYTILSEVILKNRARVLRLQVILVAFGRKAAREKLDAIGFEGTDCITGTHIAGKHDQKQFFVTRAHKHHVSYDIGIVSTADAI